MGGWCCVPTCDTGSRAHRNGLKLKDPNVHRVSLFRVPKDAELRKEWAKRCDRVNKMKATDFVCRKHFLEEDISSDWRTLMPNGEVMILKKGRPDLKPGAIPTIFPEPSYSTRRKTPLKSLKVHQTKPTTDEAPEVISATENSCGTHDRILYGENTGATPMSSEYELFTTIEEKPTILQETDFWYPLEDAKHTELPSLDWGTLVFVKENTVIFIQTDTQCNVLKAVKFCGNLIPKVFINGCETECLLSPPKNIHQVSKYLELVKQMLTWSETEVTDSSYSMLSLNARGEHAACNAKRSYNKKNVQKNKNRKKDQHNENRKKYRQTKNKHSMKLRRNDVYKGKGLNKLYG